MKPENESGLQYTKAEALGHSVRELEKQRAVLVDALTQVRSHLSSGTPSADESDLLDVIEEALANAKNL